MEKVNKVQVDKLSFVLYEEKSAPRYYEIKKSLFRFFLYGLPTITFISIVGVLLFLIYFKQIREIVKLKEPAIIEELQLQKTDLLARQKELEVDLVKLQNKLALGPPSDESLSPLKLFKDSPGRQDLTKVPRLKVEEIDTFKNQASMDFNFKIINLTKDQTKLAGFVFVMAQFNNVISFWPAHVFSKDEMLIPFNKGELFATSRFRPVKAKFYPPKDAREGLFKILIFNRTGDLVYKQIISKEF